MQFRNDTLISVLEQQASVVSKGVTVIVNGSTEDFVSYAELRRRALMVLNCFREKNIGRGDEVVMQIDDAMTFLVVFWACILGNIVPIPLSTGKQDDHKTKLLKIWKKLSNPFLVIETQWSGRLKRFLNEENLAEEFSLMFEREIIVGDVCRETDLATPEEIDPSTLAYVQFSSGSTGDPKGICLTHDNLIVNMLDIYNRSEMSSEDSILSWMPLTHDMGLICFHLTGLLAGSNQYIMSTDLFVRRPALWIDKASEHKVTQLYSPNFGLKYFLSALSSADTSQWDLSAVRIIYNGAEPISHNVCREFTSRLKTFGLKPNSIFPGYGLAEASVAVCLPRPGEPLSVRFLKREAMQIGKALKCEEEASGEEKIGFVEVGYPMDHCKVRIVDQNDIELPENFLGHIQIKGWNVSASYYNDESDGTKSRTTDGWFRTWDLGFFFNGRLVITGRWKSLIIINGQNYYPQDLENVAYTVSAELPDRVVACGVRDKENDAEQLMLFVLFKRTTPDFIPLVRQLQSKIEDVFGIPLEKIVAIRKIPRTTSGKIRYHVLTESYYRGEFDEQLEEIRQLLDSVKKREWTSSMSVKEKLMGIAGELGITYHETAEGKCWPGLSSLKAMQFVSRIGKYLGKELTVKEIFDTGNIDALCRIVDEREENSLSLGQTGKQEDDYPLTPQQRKFWVIDRLQGKKSQSIIKLAYRVKGRIQKDALEEAFARLVERHHSLRTIFYLEETSPRQRVISPEVLDFRITYFTEDGTEALPGNDMTEMICHLQEPFDLVRGPLFRVIINTKNDDDHLFMFAIHHIIADGWSIHVLFDELSRIYGMITRDKPIDMPVLSLQYPEYARWNALQDERNARHRDYWLEELRNMPSFPELAFADNSHSTLSYEGESAGFSFPPEVFSGLQRIAEDTGASLFTVVYSLIYLILYQYTGQKNLVLGTCSAGRNHSELEPLIGLFINTLCIKVSLDVTNDFASLVRQVRKALLNGMEHEDYPSERLVTDLELTPDWFRSPFFNTLVLFRDFEGPEPLTVIDNNWKITPVRITQSTALVELQFEFFYDDDKLSCEIVYDRGLFSKKIIDLFIERLLNLVSRVIMDPLLPLNKHHLLLNGERETLLNFNCPPASRSEDTVCSLFDRYAIDRPDVIAIKYGDSFLCYGALKSDAEKVASFLRITHNVSRGSRVGLLMNRSDKMLVLILGIIKAGATFVPLDPDYPAERIRFMAGDSNLNLIFADREDHTGIAACPVISIGPFFEELSDFPQYQATPVSSDIAYILYTSGTTGLPKGVLVDHYALADYVLTFISYFKITADDTIAQQSSIGFDVFMEEVFPALCTGARIVIVPKGGRDPKALIESINHENITILSSTPAVLKELNEAGTAMPSLRHIISGGDFLPLSFIDKLFGRIILHNTYGPTEGTVCATYHTIEDPDKSAVIGKPIQNKRVYILNEGLEMTPVGVTGQLYIAGKGISRGYLHQEEATRRKFVNDQFVSGESMYATGDMGKWLPDGTIKLSGRKDDQLKIKGFRIEPEEVEEVIMEFPDISDVVVGALKDDSGVSSLAAYYCGSLQVDQNSLRSYLLDRLPYFMLPSFLVQVTNVPYTLNGKKDRNAVFSLLLEPARQKENISEDQTRLLTIWKGILGNEDISIFDNFFELGGDSIKATRMSMCIQEVFGCEISLRNIMLNPTVALMTPVIAAIKGKLLLPPVSKISTEAFYELSHAQKRLWMMDRHEGGQLAYNMAWAFELEGELDTEKLGHCFGSIIKRHEIFRTVFPSIHGEPRQMVYGFDEFPYGMEVVSLTGITYAEQEADQLMRKDIQEAFTIEKGPLFKIKLFQLQQHKAILFIGMHHIIADGWSLAVFVRELNTLYSSADPWNALPLPRIQYKDYTSWHNKLLQSGLLNESRQYWMEQFRNVAPSLELPYDFSRPAGSLFNGATLQFRFKQENASFLQQYGEKRSVSLFVVLLTLINTLIYRYTGEEDIVIGTAFAGRQQAELKDQIGFYVNTIALRNRIFESDNFLSLMNRVNESFMQASQHQVYPFDLLIEDIGLKVQAGRSPLFNIMVVLQNNDITELKLGSLQVAGRPLITAVSKYDIYFDIQQSAGTILCNIEYNTDIFRKDRIINLFGSLETLAESLREEHGRLLDELEIFNNTIIYPSHIG